MNYPGKFCSIIYIPLCTRCYWWCNKAHNIKNTIMCWTSGGPGLKCKTVETETLYAWYHNGMPGLCGKLITGDQSIPVYYSLPQGVLALGAYAMLPLGGVQQGSILSLILSLSSYITTWQSSYYVIYKYMIDEHVICFYCSFSVLTLYDFIFKPLNILLKPELIIQSIWIIIWNSYLDFISLYIWL